ncbi:MAG: molybdenum cofactor biosynthesis protein B [Gammaproteobacteria bacterium]|nr:molybdenum cofactor biosynthesis protein B [Gammaproteobacteria bacterium]
MHAGGDKERPFVPLRIAVLTISDTRDEKSDTSGQALIERLQAAGHVLAERAIMRDDIYQMRAIVSRWVADDKVNAVLTTGGTGLTGRDRTPEAIRPLLDKVIEGFGETFRAISYEEIRTSTLQSRAFAGIARDTFIFCIPGSTGACRTAWDRLIKDQLDYRNRPCNLVEMLPRLLET